jgi:PAS domain S-box-containing protein
MLFRQLPGAVWMTDSKLSLTYVAGRLANTLSPIAEPGMSVYDVVGTRDPGDRVVAGHFAALSGEPQAFDYRFRARWYEIFIEQLKNGSGRCTGCIASAFDVTEQREVQQRLARSEAMLAESQRMAHVGSFEWDVDSNVVTWSDELHRIYGLKPGQFRGTYEAFLEHVHPDDLESTRSTILDALRRHSSLSFEHRIVRTDGSARIVHTRGAVAAGRNNQGARLAGCCWDITEFRDAVNKLEQARSLLAAAIEATPDGLIIVDRNGNVTAYNQRFVSLWRHPPDLSRQQNLKSLMQYLGDELDQPEPLLYRISDIASQPERDTFDMLFFKDGRVMELYSRPQRTGSGVAGRVWSFRDVSDRERMLRRALFLSDAARLLGSLDIEPALDSLAHLAVPLMGAGCAIDLLGNGQPRRLFVATQDSDTICPELHSAVMAGHSIIYSMGARSCMAVPLIVKRTVAGAMTFVGPPLRSYAQPDLEFAETLARRTALSVENSRLFHKAQDALRARSEFLTIAAHEIRGPITSIHMAVQGLQRSSTPSSAAPKLFEIIEREDRRLARFVDELMNLGKIQNGDVDFKLEQVDLGDVVREAANNLGDDLAASGSSLSITTAGCPVGEWDKYGLHQVAMNLLSNAIKFGSGKPIQVSVKEEEGLTRLEVMDQGIGIAPEVMDRLFKPFERGVSIRNYGGLGLGLFITKTIVDGLGGSIRVRSNPGQGSTFTVELRNARNL